MQISNSQEYSGYLLTEFMENEIRHEGPLPAGPRRHGAPHDDAAVPLPQGRSRGLRGAYQEIIQYVNETYNKGFDNHCSLNINRLTSELFPRTYLIKCF